MRLSKSDLDTMVGALYNKMNKVHTEYNKKIQEQRSERVKAYVNTKSEDYKKFYARLNWFHGLETYMETDEPTLFDGIEEEIQVGHYLTGTIRSTIRSIGRAGKSHGEILEEAKKKLLEIYKQG